MCVFNFNSMQKTYISEEKEKKIKSLYLDTRLCCNKIALLLRLPASRIQNIIKNAGIVLRTRIKYNVNDNIFEKIDTEGKAYWLGFLYADGCNYQGKQGSVLKLFLAEQDKEHIKKFKLFLGADNPIAISISKDPKDSDMYGITISSKKICKDLNKLGCTPRKTFTLSFPYNIVPEELVCHFIRGYFDGDGCFSFGVSEKNGLHSISLFTTTKQMCDGIEKTLNSIRLTFYLTKRHKNDTNNYTIGCKGNKQSVIMFNYLYGNATIFLDRKYNHFLDFLRLYKSKLMSIKTNNLSNSAKSNFTQEDINKILKSIK